MGLADGLSREDYKNESIFVEYERSKKMKERIWNKHVRRKDSVEYGYFMMANCTNTASWTKKKFM